MILQPIYRSQPTNVKEGMILKKKKKSLANDENPEAGDNLRIIFPDTLVVVIIESTHSLLLS